MMYIINGCLEKYTFKHYCNVVKYLKKRHTNVFNIKSFKYIVIHCR